MHSHICDLSFPSSLTYVYVEVAETEPLLLNKLAFVVPGHLFHTLISTNEFILLQHLSFPLIRSLNYSVFKDLASADFFDETFSLLN